MRKKIMAALTTIILLISIFSTSIVTYAEPWGQDPPPAPNENYVKFEPQDGATQTKSGITVTFGDKVENEYKSVSWIAVDDIQVLRIYVKAGDGGDTIPVSQGTSSGTGLTAPDGKGISHVSFYYVVKEEPQPVNLTVKKVLLPSDGQTDVSQDKQGFRINIKADDQIIHWCSMYAGNSTVFQILPGVYTIEEDFTGVDQDVYSFKKISVNNVDIGGNTITIGDQDASVIVYNEKKIEQQEETGQITINKVVQKQVGEEWVEVNDDPTEFKITVVTEDRIDEIEGSPFTVSVNNPFTITGLPYGAYRLAEKPENMPAGYEQYRGQDYNNVITVSADNPAAEYTFINRKNSDTPPVEKGTVTIKKVVEEFTKADGWVRVDNDTDFYVDLYSMPGETKVNESHIKISAKEGGSAVLPDMPYGTYLVKEVDIPVGYSWFDIQDDKYGGTDSVTLNADNKNGVAVIVNRITPEQENQAGNVKVIKTITPSGVPQKGVVFKLHISSEDIRSLSTDEKGEALFENVPAGTYTLEEVKPSVFETKINGTAADSVQVAVKAAETIIVNVANTPIVNEGETYDPGLKIKGYKFNDLDKDGERDENEPGLPNWVIQLWPDNTPRIMAQTLSDDENTPIAETKTDADGYYEFTGLGGGYYIVKEVPQTGWQCSTGLEHMVRLYGNPYTGETTAINLLDDATFKKAMPNENTVFEAEGRIGLPGERDYELDLKTIHPTTVIKAQEYVDGWKNFAEPQPFRLSLRHTGGAGAHTITVTFEALGKTLQTTLDNQYPNDIMIRTRSAEPGSGIIINNLVFNEKPVEGTSVAVNGVRGTDILWLSNLNMGIYSNFDLTGEIMMFWDEDAVPERSELAFQIAVGDAEQSQTEFVDFGNYQTGDPEEPDLPTISKTDERTSARLGDALTYKITVDPNDYSFDGAYLLESPDRNTEYIGGDEWRLVETKADGSKIYRYDLHAYEPTLSRLDAPYVPQIPDFKVRVKSSAPSSVKSVINTVKLYFDEEKDPLTARDTTAINRPVIDVDPDDPDDPDTPVNPGKPDLIVTKTDNGLAVSPGGLVEYTITVINKGTAYAQDVKVYETVPEGATFVADRNQGWVLENGKYVYSLGTLNMGEKKEVRFILRVNDPFPSGLEKILNNVEVKDNGTETATTDNKASDDTPILIGKTVETTNPPTTPQEPPTPPQPPVDTEKPQLPDLPFTGGMAEAELIFAGLGAILMGAGLVLKRK